MSDRDGDGVPDKIDVFPDNKHEWKDSDGDGIGDNTDAYPYNADCFSATLPCDKKVGPETKPLHPKMPLDPSKLDMTPRHIDKGLPPQGYDEFHPGVRVKHDNTSHTADWQGEFPKLEHSHEEEVRRICEQHPNNTWCARFKAGAGGKAAL